MIASQLALKMTRLSEATCSIVCLTGRARTGRGSARPARGRPASCVCTSPSPISAPEALAVCTHAPRAPLEPEITGVHRGKRAPPPAITAQARPLWPVFSVNPQPHPSPWIASSRACGASPSLSRGIASPEKRIHPRRTSVTRHRA
jgi:hypothetical protein